MCVGFLWINLDNLCYLLYWQLFPSLPSPAIGKQCYWQMDFQVNWVQGNQQGLSITQQIYRLRLFLGQCLVTKYSRKRKWFSSAKILISEELSALLQLVVSAIFLSTIDFVPLPKLAMICTDAAKSFPEDFVSVFLPTWRPKARRHLRKPRCYQTCSAGK